MDWKRLSAIAGAVAAFIAIAGAAMPIIRIRTLMIFVAIRKC